MHSRTVEQVRSWDSRPFSGGLDALSTLSDDGHTGAVVADDTWLFMLNGRVIGVFEGTIEDFSASGTVYSTSEDGLPLLFSMQEREGRTRAKYFTEDTPLNEADQTLADANFTGYIELSENVLSGDYYLVYYGGTRRSVAFVGQSERVETAEDAFELAAEEVGLYEVKDVSMTITEIPEAAAGKEATTDDAEPAVAATPASAEPVAEEAEESTPIAEAEESVADETVVENEPTETVPEAEASADPEQATTSSETAAGNATTESTRPEPGTAATEGTTEPRHNPETDRKVPESATPATESETEGATTDDSASVSTADAEGAEGEEKTEPESDSEDADELERRFQEEAEWRQTRAIPALSPEETASFDPDGTSSKGAAPAESGTPDDTEKGSPSPKTASTKKRQQSGDQQSSPSSRSEAQRTGPRSVPERGGSNSQMEKLRAAVSERDDRIEALESRLSETESERRDLENQLEVERQKRTELESELESLREERDRLSDRIDTLEADGQAGPEAAETTRMDPGDALAGTNLFVRYGSKGKPTLEALGEEVDPEAVNENLTLEHHTQFESETVTVEGQDFRTFLEDTGAFKFVSWVLRKLPYELLDTGKRSSMPELFDAISAVDRIELDGSVTADPESGTAQTFALVMRDRMGNPLIVGAYNEGRNPVREDQLETLLEGARDVADTAETLVGAFYVTASFFDPDALELAENAASSGGLFSRQEKASYVTTDSGNGFHLGLVEDRSQSFHVTVPKL